MVLSRDAIAALVPQRGAMCLLEEVLAMDAASITCRAVNHRDAAHPLRENGVLPAVCGVEYAAQAMAVHGAAMAGTGATDGMLAAVRDLVLGVERLDDVADDLIVTARRLVGESQWLLYEFELRAGARQLLSGRATVMLSVGNTR